MNKNIKYIEINKNKKENKLFVLLGGILGLIVATLFGLFVAWQNESHGIVVMFALGAPIGGIIGAGYLEEKKKEKLKKEDSWDIEDNKQSKFSNNVKQSKFNSYEPNLSIFGVVISFIFSYLAIYLSEVINLTIILKKRGQVGGFFEIFTDVAVNIFKVEWARKYLIKYWIFLTIMIVVLGIMTAYGMNKAKKLRKNIEEKGK